MKISFIVTGYNCERYAEECIESLLSQTYPDCETLVYDDASKDKTAEILSRYDVRVFRSSRNRGATFGRMRLCEIATGDVVVFVGLDDAMTLDAAEVIAAAYKPGIKLTYGNWQAMEGGAPFKVRPYPPDTFEKKTFRQKLWIATAAQTFRRNLVLSIPREKLMFEDRWINNCTDLAIGFPCLEMCKKQEVKVIKEPIYRYRQNHANTTVSRLGRGHKKAMREYLKEMAPMTFD